VPYDILGNRINTKDPFGLGIRTSSKKKTDRDTRRSFTQSQKNEIWDKQEGMCAKCEETLKRAGTHYDHKIPWEKGGKTEVKNGQALCATCHSIKSNKDRLKNVDKKRKPKPSDAFGFGEFKPPKIKLF